MPTPEQKNNIDTILSYLLIKKLVTPITRSRGYKLGIVNNVGKMLREPTSDEKSEFTLLDKISMKLKRLLGSKLLQFNSFLYLSTMNNDFYNKLVVRGSVTQRAEIQRIVKDVAKLGESYNISFDEMLQCVLTEELLNDKEKLLNE